MANQAATIQVNQIEGTAVDRIKETDLIVANQNSVARKRENAAGTCRQTNRLPASRPHLKGKESGWLPIKSTSVAQLHPKIQNLISIHAFLHNSSYLCQSCII